MERLLSPMEFGLWFMDMAARSNFLFVAELSGDLPDDVLRAAVDSVQSRHPLLRSSIVLGKRRRARFAPCNEQIPLRRISLPASLIHLERALEDENHERFDTERGPLCRLTLIDRGGGPILVATLHHSIADGICGAHLVADLLVAADDLMRGRVPGDEVIENPGPVEALFPRRTRWLDMGKVALTMMRQGIGTRLDRYDFAPLDASVPPSQRRQRFVLRELSTDETAALLERSRAENTSLHGSLSAAQLLAIAEEVSGEHTPQIPQLSLVDLRKRLPEPVDPRVMGVFISSAESVHRLIHDDLWELAHEVKAAIEREIERNTPLTYWPSMMRMIYRTRFRHSIDTSGADALLAGGEGLRPTASVISNIGRLSAPELTSFSLEKLHFLMSLSGSGFFSCSANSYSGRLFLNFTHVSPSLCRERAVRMADRTCDHLRASL